jgi:prepilin-type N-terminal cleavage/methylation domain-containing protein
MMRPQRAGFTLIELLIVISILGLLAAAFLPDLIGTRDRASEAQVSAMMVRLQTGCNTFKNANGYYPPDDLIDPQKKLSFKTDNGQNTGIESLVAFLSQSRKDGEDLSDAGGSLTNTDQDDHGAMLPMLNRKERLEISDAWGTPLAYFSHTTQTLGFGKPQSITGVGGQQLREPARARKNQDGAPLGAGKIQLLAAGKDGEFGTADDLSWPER